MATQRDQVEEVAAAAASSVQVGCDLLSVFHRDRPALRRVSFAVRPGEMVGIVEPNGSGESMLLRLWSGTWRAMGRPPTEQHRRPHLDVPPSAAGSGR